MKRIYCLVLLILCFTNYSFSQAKFTIQNKDKSDKIKFELINNLIIIPVEINGVELSFLLDTGVSKPIIFNFLNVSDTLKIKNTESFYLRGLGEGESVEALKSKNNILRVGDALKLNQDLYAIYDSNLNFAPRLGIQIHGIIGYDLFKDLIVELNYSGKYIRLTEPKFYEYKTCKKCEQLNLEFYNNKPYLNAKVKLGDNEIPVKLLIDSGGSDSIWLFEDDSLGIKPDKKYYYDFLGHGLSGSLYGNRSVLESFSLKSFMLKNVNVAFPDSSSIVIARRFEDRNGSISGNVLKRFNFIVDYGRAIITLKKNNFFKEKFSYNRSGIELAHKGVRLVKEYESMIQKGDNPNKGTRIVLDNQYKLSLKPAYSVVELRKGSPAHKVGVQLGDIILSVNGKSAHQFSLQELMKFFYDDIGKRIRLRVDRDGSTMNFVFLLEDIFK